MPHPLLDKVAKVTGLDRDELEKRWEDAKKIAKEEYDTEDNWEIITGIFKHSLGKENNDKLEWVTQWKKNEMLSYDEFMLLK
jgi:hypothetical protein